MYGNNDTVLHVNLSMFITGMSIAWTSPVLVKLSQNEWNPLGKPLTTQETELIGSLFFIAAAVGPFLFIKSSAMLGRKMTVVICLVPMLMGYAILIFATRIELYYLGRILNGITIGPICGLSQLYLSEIIFSVKTRGPYLAINSPALQSGLLVSYIVGTYVSVIVFNLISFLITLFVIILIAYGCPESPHFILDSKGKAASLYILKKLNIKEAEKELILIEEDLNKETQCSLVSLFKSEENMKPFLMATTLLLLQQFSGIAILMSYSQQIFLKASEILPSEQCPMVVGVMQVLSASATTFTSKRFTRKSLLMFSLFGSGFSDLILGLYFFFEGSLCGFNWIPLVALVLFVIVYNSGLDPLPWVYLGEIFPPHFKTVGSAASVFLYWFSFSLSSIAFNNVDISYLFLAYSGSCFIGLVYVKLKLTETKDKTLREIQRELLT
ncbi:facilitated trehalose transporter Tret1-like [Coccinella septempunctata]|uniref:facilitated trehalose transporter Tret1-like n=1 Tax=Coccinella septempunctata TaxID=41139 RepID=UPI001D062C37|nr:facilitated trehalose transporter Tret1-like [Coccinella septempunctata]